MIRRVLGPREGKKRMVFVTGNTHRSDDIARFLPEAWPAGQSLGHCDYLIVCGDFGGVWTPGKRDERILGWWDMQPWTTLFLDGNHENHDALDAMPVTERWGGRIHAIPGHDHLVHLMRGEVYDLPVAPYETASVLVMGGARSTDRTYRTEGVNWWKREMPSEEEYDRCTANLDTLGWKVDFVLTHDLPADLRMAVLDWRSYADVLSRVDRLANYLQWLYERLDRERLRMWYAGHYHVDEMVNDKVRVLFRDIVPLGEASGNGKGNQDEP